MSTRHRWTEHEKRIILGVAAEFGNDRARCAAAVGRPMGATNNYIDRVIRPEFRASVDSYGARMRAQREVAPVRARRDLLDVLTIPPAPFAVEIPAPAASKAKRFTTAVLYGDEHVPFADAAAMRVVQGVVRDVRPDVLVHMGDLVDCWQVSRFDKDPARLDTLQSNIDDARRSLHEMAQIAPKARRVLLEGNHENRLSRCIASLDGGQRELARLRAFQEAVQWPNLLQLGGIGWEWVPEREQSRTPVLPKIITKHGSVVRKWSGWSGKGEWEKYGRSGASGHTHRLGWFVHRDHNGNANWIETGCTCQIEAPYGVDFDWQHGCVVVTWNTDQRLQNVEFVSIRDGAAIWRDREYAQQRAA